MKKYILILLSSLTLNSMEPQKVQQGPMDSAWFYEEGHEFTRANQLHQEQKWAEASKEYRDALARIKPTDNVHKPGEIDTTHNKALEYDKHQAQLNLSACLLAQREETEHWASFDALLHIPTAKQISSLLIHHYLKPLKDQIILVRTDQISISDIFYFLAAAYRLKKLTECYIVLSIPKLLKETLASPTHEYGFNLIDAQDRSQMTHYETHLISLLGHLHLTPAQMNPEKVVLSAPERAMIAVKKQIDPFLGQGKYIVVADKGKANQQVTVIGGRQLARDIDNHDRYLHSKAFISLLNNHPDIVVIDCSKNIIIEDKELKKRCVNIAHEKQPFDTTIALARIMSNDKNKRFIALGTDTDQTNILACSLDREAQNRMAFIIPHAQEYDARMEGEGSKYKHMISNCWVYKCATPTDQTKVIEEAYNDLMKYALKDTL